MSETVKQSISVTIPRPEPTSFVLEPWGEVYQMPGLATFDIAAEGPPGGVLEVTTSQDSIIAFAWPGAVVRLYHNGQELGGWLDGWDRPPPPGLPEGMTMRGFVNFMRVQAESDD